MHKNWTMTLCLIALPMWGMGHLTPLKQNHNPFEPPHANVTHITLDQSHTTCQALLTRLARQHHINLIHMPTPPQYLDVHWSGLPWHEAWQQTLAHCHCTATWQAHTLTLTAKPLRTTRIFTLQHTTLPKDAPFWVMWQKHLAAPSHVTPGHHPTQVVLWGTQQEAHRLQTMLHTMDQTPAVIACDVSWVLLDTIGQQQLGLHNTTQKLLQAKTLKQWSTKTAQHWLTHTMGAWSMQQALRVFLSHMSQAGHAHTIASPHLVTQDGQPAQFKTGILYPFVTKNSRGSLQTTFKPISLSLHLTPYLLKDGWIELHIDSKQERIQSHQQGTPIIQTHAIATTVRLRPNQTIALGGTLAAEAYDTHTQHGLLSQWPLFHALLDTQDIQRQQRRLYIWITPTLQKSPK